MTAMAFPVVMMMTIKCIFGHTCFVIVNKAQCGATTVHPTCPFIMKIKCAALWSEKNRFEIEFAFEDPKADPNPAKV